MTSGALTMPRRRSRTRRMPIPNTCLLHGGSTGPNPYPLSSRPHPYPIPLLYLPLQDLIHRRTFLTNCTSRMRSLLAHTYPLILSRPPPAPTRSS